MMIKRRSIYVVLVQLMLIPFFVTGQNEFDPDTALKELVSSKENIGVSAGYSVNGEVKWIKSAGWQCKNEEQPFSSTTLTRIASIAKTFTAVAAMQLVERELIDLDVPIDRYISGVPDDKRVITLRQLLAHTAGIPEYEGKKEMESTTHYPTLQDAMEVFIERPLLFKPGTQYQYTTYGYVVIGRIIEEVSGMSFEEYMQANIWDVAGMKDTGIELHNRDYDNKSCLYHKGRRKAKEGKPNDLSNRIPGGGFYSTTEDVIRFGHALLDGRLISQASFKAMLLAEAVEYDGNKYGLGWFLYGPPPNENVVIGHSGGQTGCTSQLMIVPQSKTVIVVLSNTSGNYPQIVNFASSLLRYSETQE